MGKLIISTHITVDGVIGPNPREWGIFEGEGERYKYDQLLAADAFVLGRKVYEGLASYWPTAIADTGFAERTNSLPKYVASRTLEEPLTWNASLIKGDLTQGVAELKRQHRGQPDLIRRRRAGLRAGQPRACGRDPLLGRPGGVGQRRTCLPRPPDAYAADRRHDVRLWRRAAHVPAGTGTGGEPVDGQRSAQAGGGDSRSARGRRPVMPKTTFVDGVEEAVAGRRSSPATATSRIDAQLLS